MPMDGLYVAVPRMAWSDECPWMVGQIFAPRQQLLDNCSCIVLLPAIPGSMRYSN
jgi:hypothetical protein